MHCDKIVLYNKQVMNLNSGFYKDLDTNFEQACYLSEQKFSHIELLELLKNGNVPQKQIAALKFDFVNNEEDACALVSNLTGCDGKIREAVALKIYKIIYEFETSRVFFMRMPVKIYADATVDINANICRLIVDSMKMLNNSEIFASEYASLILQYAMEALDELDKCVYRDKKYVKNKQLFKLYWCLESLRNFYSAADALCFSEIMQRSALLDEYTIREKVAQIAVQSDDFLSLQKRLKNDSNYYVRSVFLHH